MKKQVKTIHHGEEMKEYTVTIPYYHQFRVEARNKKEAITRAASCDGEIIGRDDAHIEVEENDPIPNTRSKPVYVSKETLGDVVLLDTIRRAHEPDSKR